MFVTKMSIRDITGNKFYLSVRNPPYISTKEISSLQREVENRESRYVLDGGYDGLIVIKVILRKFLLNARGALLWLEVDD